jgi:hypothetical protein
MLTQTPPGGVPNPINRQLPQHLSIPGQQQQAFSGQSPLSGQNLGGQLSGLGTQAPLPTMMNSPAPPSATAAMAPHPGMGAPGQGAGLPGGAMSPQMPGAQGSPMMGMPGQYAGTGMSSPGPQGAGQGQLDPQVQSMVTALSKPGQPTPTY